MNRHTIKKPVHYASAFLYDENHDITNLSAPTVQSMYYILSVSVPTGHH